MKDSCPIYGSSVDDALGRRCDSTLFGLRVMSLVHSALIGGLIVAVWTLGEVVRYRLPPKPSFDGGTQNRPADDGDDKPVEYWMPQHGDQSLAAAPLRPGKGDLPEFEDR